MLNTPKILGISMAPRKNRRLFVMVTYAILVACLAAIPVVPFWHNRIQAAWGLLFFLIYIMGNHLLFGSIVEPFMAYSLRNEEELISLRSAPRGHDPDERDLAVRNAAHYQAFRVAAIYGLVVWVAIMGSTTLNGSAVALSILIIPLLAMLWTLPQAIILWTEPDVPEEAGGESESGQQVYGNHKSPSVNSK